MTDESKPKVFARSAAFGEEWAFDYLYERTSTWTPAQRLAAFPADVEAEAREAARQEKADPHSFLVGARRIWRSAQKAWREDNPWYEEELRG